MKINKQELKDKYGIDLSQGKYRIKKNDSTYSIYTVQDDSLGCILVGNCDNPEDGKLINSKATLEKLMKVLDKEFVLTITD